MYDRFSSGMMEEDLALYIWYLRIFKFYFNDSL